MTNRSVALFKVIGGITILLVQTMVMGFPRADAGDRLLKTTFPRDHLTVAQSTAGQNKATASKPIKVPMSSHTAHHISKTRALLVDQALIIREDLDWLKAMDQMDRRGKIAIERNLKKAADTLDELQQMRQAGSIDLSRTNAVTYDLGMAGDAMAKWASKLSELGISHEQDAKTTEQWNISRKLLETAERLDRLSKMLWETAKAVVDDLK